VGSYISCKYCKARGTSHRVFFSSSVTKSTMALWHRYMKCLPVCHSVFSTFQATGIALKSHRFDIIEEIYKRAQDTLLLSYTVEAMLDTGFSLLYHNQVLHKLPPSFPSPTMESKSPHIHAPTWLLVTLGNASLTVPLLTSLVQSSTSHWYTEIRNWFLQLTSPILFKFEVASNFDILCRLLV